MLMCGKGKQLKKEGAVAQNVVLYGSHDFEMAKTVDQTWRCSFDIEGHNTVSDISQNTVF